MKTALSICTILLSLFASTTTQSLRAQRPIQDTTQATSQPPQPLGELGWVNVPIDTNLYVVLGYISKDTCYAVNAASYYRSLDGGQTWERVSWAIPISGGIGFVDAKNGYVATGTTHTAYHTTDGGQTWTSADDKDQLVSLVAPVSKDTCFLSGANYVSRTTDGGKTWNLTFLSATGIEAIAFADSKHGIVVGTLQAGPLPQHHEQTAGCFTTSDGGETWVEQYTGVKHDLGAICYIGNSTVMAVGGIGIISRSTDGGSTWDSIQSQFLDRTHGLFALAANSGRLLSVGGPGLILTSLDSGQTWQKEESGITTNLESVAMFSDKLAIAAGDNGVILKTTNGGQDWVQLSPPSPTLLETSASIEAETPFIDIRYALPQLQDVTIKVYDLMGKEIETLEDHKLETAGSHTLKFNSTGLTSGVYLYHIDTERYHGSSKFEVAR